MDRLPSLVDLRAFFDPVPSLTQSRIALGPLYEAQSLPPQSVLIPFPPLP